MSSHDELPASWVEAPLGNLASSMGGGTPDTRETRFWEHGSIPWVSPKDMKVFEIRHSIDKLNPAALERLSLIPKDSVLLVVRSGILAHTLPVALNVVPTMINQDMRAFAPPEGLNARFLAWQLVARGNDILRACAKDGTTVASIESSRLASFEIALAPQREQERIVGTLEDLLSDLDAGVDELHAAKRKLSSYRQSLLKAAVEGALTAEWREQNPSQETGAELLARILHERQTRWEVWQIQRFEQKGKSPPNDWRSSYFDPPIPSPPDSSIIPPTWTWATMEQLTLAQRYGSSAKTSEEASGVPVIRMGNIQSGKLVLSDLKYLPSEHAEFPGLLLRDGELLFNRTNSPELVGKTAVFRSQLTPCSFASYLIGVITVEQYLPEFASAFINSLHGRSWVASVVTQQVGQANVNGSKLAALVVPLPPEVEQRQILTVLSEQSSALDAQSMAIEHGLRLATAQRQNILRAAFAGKLVPQDPTDEPASVLLERIRTERAAQAAAPKVRRARASRATT